MDFLRTFSDAEMRALQDLVQLFMNNRFNIPSKAKFDDSFAGEEDHQSPEVYIAKPQSEDGIPGLTRGEGSNPDKAGEGLCDIYRILKNGSGDPEIIAIEALEKTVYNLSEDATDQDWLPIHRDKFGNWLTTPPGSGGGLMRIRAEIISVDCNAEPIEAVCMVLSRPCGVAQVTGEDEFGQVTVYDRLGCVFTEPEADLIGRQLKADYLDSGFLGTGTVAAGTGSDDQPCQWEADFLCCGEDDCV